MIADLPDLFAKRAALQPDAVALQEFATGRTLSYAELDRRAGKVAALLAQHGVTEGDRVAILCRNRIAFFEILLGCAKMGAILVPLNWRMPPPELDGLVADAEPALLFYGREDAEVPRRLSRSIPAIALDGGYESLVAAARPHAGRCFWPEESIWYLLYTSGTTGRPKGVIYTYAMAFANYVNVVSGIGLTAADTTLNYLPLFHTAGINLHSLPALFAGGRVVILPSADIDPIVAALEDERIDVFFGVPTIYQMLLDHPRVAALPLGRVRHWSSGGAALPDYVAEAFRGMGVRICNGMGMTETGPTAFMMPYAAAWDRIGSVGKPLLLASARIVDEDGQDVPDGEAGELLFGGPGVTPGYWRNPEATAEAFTADGWLRSGDIARREPDGFYYLEGRRKEMFISGGENVLPIEVENVLASHPAVIEAAVVAGQDPHWGEVGHAFLRLAPGAVPDAAAFYEHCRERLAPYKVPKSFTIVADFPRAESGKIQKRLLIR